MLAHQERRHELVRGRFPAIFGQLVPIGILDGEIRKTLSHIIRHRKQLPHVLLLSLSSVGGGQHRLYVRQVALVGVHLVRLEPGPFAPGVAQPIVEHCFGRSG